jgi:6-pyruvoyltetrahydropterin/6-carboxytetrahydropterin synthase
MLTGHEGLCKNLHGHTYKVEVTVARAATSSYLIEEGADAEMVFDFKNLKHILDNCLFDKLDHSFIYNSQGGLVEYQIAELLQQNNMRVFNMGCRPTAENMTRMFTSIIRNEFLRLGLEIRLISLTVWETPTAYATYS